MEPPIPVVVNERHETYAMDLKDVLRHARVSVDQRFADKDACLTALSRRAAADLAIDPAGILAGLSHRESLGSTGLGRGIALPHARLVGITEPYIALARLRDAIPFDAVDDKPVDIVCLVLLPAAAGGQSPAGQLNVLAGIARRLRDPVVLTAIRGGRDARIVQDTLVIGCATQAPSVGEAR